MNGAVPFAMIVDNDVRGNHVTGVYVRKILSLLHDDVRLLCQLGGTRCKSPPSGMAYCYIPRGQEFGAAGYRNPLHTGSALFRAHGRFPRIVSRSGAEIRKALDAAGTRRVLVQMSVPTMFPVALKLAEAGFDVRPLITDDPEYILTKWRHSGKSRRKLLDAVRRVLESCPIVGVASPEAGERYMAWGAPGYALIRFGTDNHAFREPEGSDINIAFSGSMYAKNAVQSFLAALNGVNWMIDNRRVTLRVYGGKFRLQTTHRLRIDYRGWVPDEELESDMSDCHFAYLPHPLGLEDNLLSRYSFPNKLSTYAAAGLPVLAHADPEASYRIFVGSRDVGVPCSSLESRDIIDAIRLICDEANNRRQRNNIRQAYESDFCESTFKASLTTLLT